jgi:hypothetical protein
MPRGLKDLNQYVVWDEATLAMYRKTPKSVYAAIAMSLANVLDGDDPIGATGDMARVCEILRDEWQALHNCGIVPQQPK